MSYFNNGIFTKHETIMIDPQIIEKYVLEFFFAFSRFEFSLKEAGFLTTFSKNSDNAAPDWDLFIKKYKREYFGGEQAKDAINYLLSNPPQKQKIQNELGVNTIIWGVYKVDPKAPLLKTLVEILKIVRNNLFHGGKYGCKGWDDKERVCLLLSNSSIVIKDWLYINDDINTYYNDLA